MSATVDIKGAAALLQVHPKTALDLVANCELPAAKIGRSYVILQKDVMTYLESAVIKQTAARMKRLPKQGGQVAAP